MRAESQHLAGLDLLRGTAALAVLLLHSTWPPSIRPPLPRGYLSVDLFFTLSGFVLARTYDNRLATRAQVRQFYRARLIRLYPLYCVTTLFTIMLCLGSVLFGHPTNPHLTIRNILETSATALLFLPTPSAWSIEPWAFFPLIFAAWSLFWELSVNFVYGVVCTRLGPTLFAVLLGIGLLGLVAALRSFGSADDVGLLWQSEWGAGARALFSFFAGVALFRLHARYRAPAVPMLLLVGLFLLCLVPEKFGGWPYELACIVLLFPLLVWLGAEASMGPRTCQTGRFVGYLSYPVYLLEAPVPRIIAPMFPRLSNVLPLNGSIELVIQLVAIVASSWFVARWFDTPVRDWLRSRFAPAAPLPTAQTAP